MTPKRVLVVNKFLHHVGGVETYVEWLGRNLERSGVEVAFFGMEPPADRDVMDLPGRTFLAPHRSYYGNKREVVRNGLASVYSISAARAMQHALDEFRPDLVHLHSTCYQLTPSVVARSIRARVALVTTAHEYKLVCSNQVLWDDRRREPCTKCLGASPSRRILNVLGSQCVKGSTSSSVAAAVELPVSHRVWQRYPGIIHAPSRFMYGLLETETSPVAGRVVYLDLPWGEASTEERSSHRPVVASLSRLAREKGVDVLIAAWAEVKRRVPSAELRIYGSGPDEAALRAQADSLDLDGICFLGRFGPTQLGALLGDTAVTVQVSRWEENSPFTVRESLRHGVPVIVTDAGGMPEMVSSATGSIVPRDDPKAVADAIVDELVTMRRAGSRDLARAVSQRAVTDEAHLAGLQEIYEVSSAI
jgi:glycosyltransferase involved in cell wall biosynthesis